MGEAGGLLLINVSGDGEGGKESGTGIAFVVDDLDVGYPHQDTGGVMKQDLDEIIVVIFCMFALRISK